MQHIDVAVGIVVRDVDGAVLISRRHGTAHLAGMWEFPGGKCERGERPEETLRREMLEEVGLNVAVVEIWPVVEHIYPERQITLFPFLCMSAIGEATGLEGQEIDWIQIPNLNSDLFPEANAAWITRLQTETEHILSLVRASSPRGPGPA